MKHHQTALNALLGSVVATCLMHCGTPPAASDGGTDSRVIVEDVTDAPPQCLSPATPQPADSPCRCNGDCAEGSLCQVESAFGVPMGRCIRACTSNAMCGAGFVCTSDMICVPTCTAAGQCGPSRYCLSGRCEPICARDADCFSGHCNGWSGRCTATADTPTGGQTGDSCLVDGDCRSNFCITGVCLSLCVITSPDCPDNEGCISPSTTRFIEGGVCRQRCGGGVVCRDPTTTCTPSSNPNGSFCD